MKNSSLYFIIPLIILIITAFWGYYRIEGHYLKVDEKAHYAQTEMFAKGEFKIYIKEGEKYPRNAMFPGYHFILSRISLLTGKCTPNIIRTILVLQSLLVALLAYMNLKVFIEPKKALICALQVYFLPILFPFHFLIYTDSMAVSAVLAALFFCLKRKYLFSAIFAFLTIFIRHNYIVLLPFFIIYPYIDNFGYKFTMNNIKGHAIKSIPFLIPFIAFVTFIILNGGRLTLDDPTSHVPTLTPGNILFCIFCCGLLFLPLHIINFKNCSNWAKKRTNLILTIIILFAVILIFYTPGHRWNYQPRFLRYEFLVWLFRDFMTRIVFCIILSLTTFSIFSIKLISKSAYLIYPFIILLLIPILLIEPRYYIVPLILFNIFRKKMKYKYEVILLLYMFILSILIHNLQATTVYVI